MPWRLAQFTPGINTEMTPFLNQNGWSASQNIRWRDGLVEKTGGWTELSATPLTGTARGIITWATNIGGLYLAVGTEKNLTLFYSNTFYDITPYEVYTNPTGPFSTTNHSTTVTLVDPGIPPATTQYVNILMPIAVGGCLLFGRYLLTTTLGVTTFTAGSAATSTTTGGVPPYFTVTLSSSTVTVTLINHGLISGNTFTVQVATTVGGMTLPANSSYTVTVTNSYTFTFTGPSSATSGASAYENSGNTALQYQLTNGYASNAGNNILREWYLDHWGQDLVATCGGTNTDLGFYFGSPIFVWDPVANGPDNHAVAINTTNYPAATYPPQAANVIFVIASEQILMVLGSDPAQGVAQDPSLVRWCDVGDFTDWVATATNQAGSFRISTGSKLVGGLRAPLYTVIWTDVDMWLVSYLGFPLVFGFNQVANSVGLLAPRACAATQSYVYWVSYDSIWIYDGNTAQVLPCPVWDIMFRNLNRTQIQKVFMAVNSWFNEIAVFFPSASGSGEVDTYIRYNYRDKFWDYGTLVRTCWCDAGVMGAPIGVDGSAILQQHETATDNNGTALGESITTGWFSIQDGDVFSTIQRMITNFYLAGSTPSVEYTISVVNYPTDTPTVYGPYTQTLSGPEYQIIKARGRYASLTIGNSSSGTFWRMGNVSYLLVPAGKR